jgi:LAO/AO transport system kinase
MEVLAAGFDTVLVETVGVGQSETAVEDLVDMFALLLPPGGGDELQGIKKGVIELADIIIINKCDGDLTAIAKATQFEYQSALKILTPKSSLWRPKVIYISLFLDFMDAIQVIACSAMGGGNIGEVWQIMQQFQERMRASGEFWRRRERQQQSWLWKIVTEELLSRLQSDEAVQRLLPTVQEQMRVGTLPVGAAADRLLQTFYAHCGEPQDTQKEQTLSGAHNEGDNK